ncbi:MAG: hypothetical protein SF069_02095 [Phycisphaerae bacterium]|nr:hypothetical protein [Phycisphaerae bacterium]
MKATSAQPHALESADLAIVSRLFESACALHSAARACKPLHDPPGAFDRGWPRFVAESLREAMTMIREAVPVVEHFRERLANASATVAEIAGTCGSSWHDAAFRYAKAVAFEVYNAATLGSDDRAPDPLRSFEWWFGDGFEELVAVLTEKRESVGQWIRGMIPEAGLSRGLAELERERVRLPSSFAANSTFKATTQQPAEAVPADADQLRDAIQAVLGCVTDLRRDTFRIRSPLSAESRVEIAAHLTALRPAIDGAVAALHALTPETIQRLGNGWRMRVRSALERIERSVYQALPAKRSDGDGFHPADATALADTAPPNWDQPYTELSRCQEFLWQLRYASLADATEIEPAVEASEPKGDEPAEDVADPLTGFVSNPRDPSAYELISSIMDQWVAREIQLGPGRKREIGSDEAERWLTDNPEIRWTRPPNRTRPGLNPKRRLIHVADAEAYFARRMDRERGGDAEPAKMGRAKSKPRPVSHRK